MKSDVGSCLFVLVIILFEVALASLILWAIIAI